MQGTQALGLMVAVVLVEEVSQAEALALMLVMVLVQEVLVVEALALMVEAVPTAREEAPLNLAHVLVIQVLTVALAVDALAAALTVEALVQVEAFSAPTW